MKKPLLIGSLLALVTPAAFSAEQANTCDFSNPGWWNQCIYGGASLGGSRLEPVAEEGSSWQVDNIWSSGPGVRVGLQALPNVFAEASFTYLGSADVSNATERDQIRYYVPAVWGAYEFLPTSSEWNFYAKGGLSVILNSIGQDAVDAVKETPAQLALGLGANYQFHPDWMARIDLDLYSLDARHLSVGVQYLVGNKPEPLPTPQPTPEPEPTPEPIPEPTPVVQVTTEEVCEEFGSALEGVRFPNDSAELTEEATTRLMRSIEILRATPELSVEIGAHTDATAGEAYNEQLSQARADAVLWLFIDNGIDPKRLSAVGYGENQPIASNDTAQGRALNRRVELVASPAVLCEEVEVEQVVTP